MQYQNAVSVKPEYKAIMMQTASISGYSTIIIKKKFPNHHIHIIPDPLNIDKGLMEIRLKELTVTFVVNQQDICSTGYLFLNKMSELKKYLTVCKKYFESLTPNSWRYKNCCIELLKEGTDYYFLFYAYSEL